MKNLFLIDGASGTGKTDLIKYISDFNINNVGYVKKYTTRNIREYEKIHYSKLDLIHIKDEAFNKMSFDYKYVYGGFKYGFSKSQIFEKFKKSDNVFIIVRNIDVINQLKNDFKFLKVITIFIYTDRDKIVRRLKKDKHKPEDIKFRIQRLGIAYKSYLNNPALYDEIIINSGSKDDYQRIINQIFKKYDDTISVEQNLIFVLMSFDPKYDNVYEEFIDAAKLVDNTLVVKRIDKQRGDYRITDEILNNIAKSNLIICDLTNERPNVYYELGYARGLNKKVITCAEKGTKLHFDIQDFRTIKYENLSQLRREIEKDLREHFNNNR